MEVRILGPLEVEVSGRRVPLGPQQRVLLSILVLQAGRVVPSLRLIELMWEEPTPEGARRTLRSHIFNLRRVLEPERHAGKPKLLVAEGAGQAAGYALRIAREQVDAVRFERLAEEGRQALAVDDPHTAAEQLRAGLELWRGQAFADVADHSFATHEVTRLEELRQAAQANRIEADLALGRHAELVGELKGLVAEQPSNEVLRRLLALALYRSRRVEEAAQVCQQGLKLLADSGLESTELQELQQKILNGSSALDCAAPETPRPFQLPPDIAEFTGREVELDRLRALVSQGAASGGTVAISAIDGKPGIGKSALAVHLAHELAPQFPDGVLYAELRGTERKPLTPLQVLGPFLRALRIRRPLVPPELDEAVRSYRTLLAGKRVLVVLDNALDAAQVRPLLPASPGCAVLVTSRGQLADLEGAFPLTLDLLSEHDAVTLLARLIGQQRVAADPASAAKIVRHCGLLPLAVRIAGAKLRRRPAWPLAALSVRLADQRRRLGELAVGDLAVRSSFLLSYEGLAPDEARTFRLLGLLDALDVTAEVVAALTTHTDSEAEAICERLADAQLLQTPTRDRYSFHDLIRLFAREQAEAEDEELVRHAALERALGWYLTTAERANRFLKPNTLHANEADTVAFPNRQAALTWLEAERTNLVAAVRQAATHAPVGIAAVAWKLSNTLWRFLDLRKYWADWQAVSEAALQAAQHANNRAAQAPQLQSLGIIAAEQRRFEEALDYYKQSLKLHREMGNREGEAMTLNSLGITYWQQQRLDEAVGCFQPSLALCQQLGDREGADGVLNNLGMVYTEQRRFDDAIACLKQSLKICQEIGASTRRTLNSLGDAYRNQGRIAEAISCYEKSLMFCHEVGDRYTEAFNLRALGMASQTKQETQAARTYWANALALFEELGAVEAAEVRTLLETPHHPTAPTTPHDMGEAANQPD